MHSKANIRKAVFIGLSQIVLLAALFIVCHNYIYKVISESQRTNGAFLSPKTEDVGLTKVDWDVVNKAKPQAVVSGVYLERVHDLDILRSKWSYEFDIWFKWNPKKLTFVDLKDSVKGAITLHKSPIKIINSSIDAIETDSFYLNSKGDSAYILFHVIATTTKSFDVAQYPLDNYLLLVQIEDDNDDINKFVFVPDTANSNVSSRVFVHGFEKGSYHILSKPHTIKSSLGDPRKVSGQRNTYSQLRFGMYIKRAGVGIYLKIFITLYIAALLGFLSFFAADSDKIRVIVGSLFFAAATLNIIISRIPTTSGISIAEIVNDISLVTIILIAARETLIKHLLKNNPELNVLNKWFTFVILIIFYVAINVSIPVMCLNSIK